MSRDARGTPAIAAAFNRSRSSWSLQMPSLFRFLAICAILGTIAYAGLLSLANMVEPRQHEIVTIVPLRPKPPAAVAPPAGVRTKTAATAMANGPDELFDRLQNLPLMR